MSAFDSLASSRCTVPEPNPMRSMTSFCRNRRSDWPKNRRNTACRVCPYSASPMALKSFLLPIMGSIVPRMGIQFKSESRFLTSRRSNVVDAQDTTHPANLCDPEGRRLTQVQVAKVPGIRQLQVSLLMRNRAGIDLKRTYSSPVSNHSNDLSNSRPIASKTSAPTSLRPCSIADR